MLHLLSPRQKPDADEMAEIGRAWQAGLRATPPSPDPLVIFAIPLIARKRAQDWTTVCRNVAMTIASLRQQSSKRWVAYICSQDRPDGVTFDDQVRFVRFRGLVYRPNEKGVRGWDKGDKRRTLLNHVLRAHGGRDGYYAQWDADDLLHPDVVAHVTEGNNGRGYLIERGVIADLQAGRFGAISPDATQGKAKTFWQVCGSSSFVRFDFRHQPRHWKTLLLRHSSHKRLVRWQQVHGLALDPIPFPAAIYTYNHGENLSALKGTARKGYFEGNPLEAADVQAAFDLAPILAAGAELDQK